MASQGTMSFDLGAYLERLGLDAKVPLAPTLDTLKTITLRHLQSIPFEGIDPFLGHEVHIDILSVQDKLVKRRRGGYCHEQNTLLKYAMEALGYDVKLLTGRIVLMFDTPQLRASTHMMLCTKIDGKSYLVDVGNGKYTLTGPLLLETGTEQTLPLRRYRLEDISHRTDLGDSTHMLCVDLGGGKWKATYTFNLEEKLMVDMEALNWFTSTSPKSPFCQGLALSVLSGEEALNMWNCKWHRTHADGETEAHEVSPEDVVGVIREVFGIPLEAELAEEITKTLRERA